MNRVSTGPSNDDFDLTGNGALDSRDIDAWLSLAGQANGFAAALLPGDSNLDGKVDAVDLNVVGMNWQQTGEASWTAGDFSADGRTTVSDLNLVGNYWRQSIPTAISTTAVPEPTGSGWWLLGLSLLVRSGGKHRSRHYG